MSNYYDLDGKPMTLLEWVALLESKRAARAPDGESSPDEDPTRIGLDHVDGIEISTVWLGIDHGFSDQGPPIIFETMIFGGEYDQHCWRYPTKEPALAGHVRIVAALRNGTSPEDDQ